MTEPASRRISRSVRYARDRTFTWPILDRDQARAPRAWVCACRPPTSCGNQTRCELLTLMYVHEPHARSWPTSGIHPCGQCATRARYPVHHSHNCEPMTAVADRKVTALRGDAITLGDAVD